MNHEIQLNVNGTVYDLSLEPRKTLLAVLRDRLGLTGTKEGCSTGDCGACTVLIDGEPVTSCLVLAVAAAGREITTVEGIADRDALHPVQEAMVSSGGAAVRLLHARIYCLILWASAEKSLAVRGRNPAGPRRQSLPVYRIYENCGGGAGGRKANGR